MASPPGVATPPIFMAFDCLVLSGQDLRDRPLVIRWNLLERLLEPQAVVLPARRLSGHGLEAWDQVVTLGYEGFVAKDPASTYMGGRTLTWLKVKQPGYRAGARGWEPALGGGPSRRYAHQQRRPGRRSPCPRTPPTPPSPPTSPS